MAVEVKVPSVGESIAEGTIARWLKKNGASVKAGDPLFELETDKATTEVAAQAAGRLTIAVPEGQTVAIGAVVGRIEEAAAAPEERRVKEQPDGRQTSAAARNVTAPPPPTPARECQAPLSPSVRRLVAEKGVDVSQVEGTGRGGRVTREDVLAHVQEKENASPAPAPAAIAETPRPAAAAAEAPKPAPVPINPDERETRQRMSAIRQRIAERLVSAQHGAAILTTFNEADLTAVMALRAKYKDVFQKKHGVGLGFMSFFVKACVEALRAFPLVNARIDGNDIVYQHFYDIGVAVSTEKGLMVPVVHDADRLGFAQVEKTIAELAERARSGKIMVADLQGGTFTITNGGIFGSLLSTPLLNPPQSGILGMHTIQKRPVAVNDQVVIRPMMYLALSYDHRLIDGREAVSFLIRVKECIENPERLLLEI